MDPLGLEGDPDILGGAGLDMLVGYTRSPSVGLRIPVSRRALSPKPLDPKPWNPNPKPEYVHSIPVVLRIGGPTTPQTLNPEKGLGRFDLL